MKTFSNNSLLILEDRYFLRNKENEITEDIESFFHRIASAIAKAGEAYGDNIEDVEKTFYQMMVTKCFLPNSPTLMNSGKENGQLAACFVLPVEDSIVEIFDAVKHAAIIHKTGGGTGFDFSKLRPSNSNVKTTGRQASGPVSFMGVFDAQTDCVKQSGVRRGANMGVLRVDHPDILSFINSKKDGTSLQNFNISVAITDDFMDALESGTNFTLRHPSVKNIKVNPKVIWDTLIENAWLTGDPGVLYIDVINRNYPLSEKLPIRSTNPCGETPLPDYGSCNLGSINLVAMLQFTDIADLPQPDEIDRIWKGKYSIDYKLLDKTIKNAVLFLDNIIDANAYIQELPIIEEISKNNREIGLGVMGLADTLSFMGLPYDSKDGLTFVRNLIQHIQKVATDYSIELGKKRGVYPNFEFNKFKDKYPDGIRNNTRLVIAPTGSLSSICGVSSGIEPHFKLVYTRMFNGENLINWVPSFEKFLKVTGRTKNKKIIEHITEEGTIENIDEFSNLEKAIFKTANDIAPMSHLDMLEAVQSGVDQACSKTINLPNKATKSEVEEIYLSAYKRGLKGVTVFRDGCKQTQVLNSIKGSKKKGEVEEVLPVKPKSEVVSGRTSRIKTACGTLIVTLNSDENGLFNEVFCTLGKTGGCSSSYLEALARVTSIGLRKGVPIQEIIDQLQGVRCPNPAYVAKDMILSCSDGIAHILKTLTQIDVPKEKEDAASLINMICPKCGSKGTMGYDAGCLKCNAPGCGHSKC
ncbi:MAG: adenosylcobalamin-dependent ribonucleoside-diphosphate reductase [Candidatus Paceibacterota bacterium]|jgi:ribonucleoside-diphosphate reductase alpha chain